MNTELRQNANNDFEKCFLKCMNNAVFTKTVEYIRNHRGIKLITTKAKRNFLMPEPN